MKRLDKPFHGKGYGCTDTGRPENSSDRELSRIVDALYALNDQPALQDALWAAVPEGTRMDFNYARWSYVAP